MNFFTGCQNNLWTKDLTINGVFPAFNVTENPQKLPLNMGPGVIYFQKPPQEVSSSEMCGQAGSLSAEAGWDFARGVGGMRVGGHASLSSKPPSQVPFTPALDQLRSQAPHVHPAMEGRAPSPWATCLSLSLLDCPPTLRSFLLALRYQEVRGTQLFPPGADPDSVKVPSGMSRLSVDLFLGFWGVSPPARPVLGSFRFLILRCHYLLENFFLLLNLVDYEFW